MARPARSWAPWVSGGLCAAWALIAWLAVVPNQDILVDGIQAQSLLIDPRIVLAFPGQKHGGPLEYPATVFFEWALPGNYYGNSAIRVVLAFLTGFVAARLAFRLFPNTRAWALLSAVALGPTMIHGLQPPGVWWMQPNYDMAWLLVCAGALLYASSQDRLQSEGHRRSALLVVSASGLLVGLGLFAHPVMILLAIPLGVLVLLIKKTNGVRLVVLMAGVGVGLIPAIASYFVNDEVNVWDPSHKPFIYPAWLWNMGRRALGLDGIPDPATALFPYAIGFSPTQVPFSGLIQTVAVAVVLSASAVVAALGIYRSARARAWLSSGTSLAITWLVVAGTMVAYITTADPVSHYSAGLAPLAWISIGALPALVPSQPLGVGLTLLMLLQFALSNWGQNSAYLTSLPERIEAKAQTQRDLHRSAEVLQAKGVEVVYGSYLDAIPIGYASNWGLRTLTVNYNRFPLRDNEREQASYRVAVRTDSVDGPALEALTSVEAQCDVDPQTLDLPVGSFAIADCPTSALVR